LNSHSCFISLLLLSIVTVGCQPANRYTAHETAAKPQPKATSEVKPPPPVRPELGWVHSFLKPNPSVPIQIVHADTDREQWQRLKNRVWNPPPLMRPAGVVALLSLEPWASTAVASSMADMPVLLRIPLGLPDPKPNIPAANPLTLSKWELGRRLFFDPSWLTAEGKTSCATCHKPNMAFADSVRQHGEFNTLSLLNCVYNSRQFWDGRALLLEEVVQRTLEDEREQPPAAPFHHVWGGVVGRLMESEPYKERFLETFGHPPTQDSLGRALATYLRTLYSGDSLHDLALQAMAERKGSTLEPTDYEKLLTPQQLGDFGRQVQDAAATARELHLGYQLFTDRVPGRTLQCNKCHSGPLTMDRGFHNVGIGFDPTTVPYPGHMAHVPIGQRERSLNGAFRTPSLRESSRTAPYFHDGQAASLGECIEKHAHGYQWNSSLDPAIEAMGLKKDDVAPLTLFLYALKGQELDPELTTPPDS
jgi:cytochrome c peroxidase